MRSCEQCRWCFLEDHGYSNWTVEGTQVYCLQTRHPSGLDGFDRWYGEPDSDGNANSLFFAEQCEGFQPGEPIHCDVEKERQYDKNSNDRPDPWWHYYTEDLEVRSLMAFHDAGFEVRRQGRLI